MVDVDDDYYDPISNMDPDVVNRKFAVEEEEEVKVGKLKDVRFKSTG